MKLTILSLFILLSILWNIGVNDYITTISNSETQANELSLISDNFQINSTAKKIQFEVFYEELTENEEEIEKEFIPFLIIKILLLNIDETLEEQQLFVVNDNLPSVNRLFIQFCSLKIPSLV
jgi:hypothetical protein